MNIIPPSALSVLIAKDKNGVGCIVCARNTLIPELAKMHDAICAKRCELWRLSKLMATDCAFFLLRKTAYALTARATV